MTPILRLSEIAKRFGEVTAVAPLTLDVEAGEFVGILGPSGCGKTTLLRIVAGLENPDHGTIVIDGHDVTRLPAHRRPVNTVFQRYLLFPHLSIGENIGFGLALNRKQSRAEIATKVEAALRLVQLEGFENRGAEEVSGGQAQRVSLARALINEPKVLLLDEPLSALDLKVRQEMQGELRRIHRETGTTFLYVTHDQQEALSMADRVIVMNHGQVEQIGTPNEIYHRPQTLFAASFVGDANVLPVEIAAGSPSSSIARLRQTTLELQVEGAVASNRGWLVLRPEALTVESETGALPGHVTDIAFLGASIGYEVDVAGFRIRIKETQDCVSPRFAVGQAVCVSHDPARTLLIEEPTPAAEPEPIESAGRA